MRGALLGLVLMLLAACFPDGGAGGFVFGIENHRPDVAWVKWSLSGHCFRVQPGYSGGLFGRIGGSFAGWWTVFDRSGNLVARLEGIAGPGGLILLNADGSVTFIAEGLASGNRTGA